MDRFLKEEVDEEERKSIAKKMIKLVNLYYWALDGSKVKVDCDLRVEAYPHFMEKKGFESYHSTSIPGRIYDETEKAILQQSENDKQIQITMLPCFTEVEATPECTSLWEDRYQEYLRKSRELISLDKEEKDDEFQKLYQNYKRLLYGAEEFEETRRAPSEVFMEACAIYRIVYERARSTKSIGKCRFVWTVVGAALFQGAFNETNLMKTGCVALVLCLNISVDPPDVIKISPCARMECWIDPFSMAPPKALENIGKTLHSQYERWQPKARYKLQLDPTVEEVKKLCNTCRKYARSERVLFHYNGHGVPKPTTNGEIWVFNKSYTQYIPLPITDLDSWLKTPSIYVFDCSAAGIIVKAFLERLDWSSSSSSSSQKDCILLAACEAHQTLPQSAEFPADVFTACLTTPIKMALHWDQQELNWIFTAITDTIAWNVLPHDLFQRLFRHDLLVASLFRNFLLAERIMRSTDCSPISYPLLPPTHQHHMWDAWDMAAEICLSKLPQLIADPNAEFQPSPFFTEQLTAFEVWLDHGSEDKKPPEQLPIVLQVLLSQSHRFRALVLLGRFLDMGPWAVDLALSVGIFPYVLKLLQTSAMELRQILVFIWTKILSLDKSCQVDLVKDGGHTYFIRFLDSLDAYPEQRAMAAFILAVIVDGHRTGQEACIHACLIDVCLRHLHPENPHDAQTEPLLLQWLCLCLGKLWEDFAEAQLLGLQSNAPEILIYLLSEPQPEVRASAVFALGNLLDMGSTSSNGADDDSDDDEKVKAKINVVRSLLQVSSDCSPLVRCEIAIGMCISKKYIIFCRAPFYCVEHRIFF
ncbi:hypothetical protein PVAP13_J096570 [Panicum virgatum]|nr:hypothetical protein PVAP13_J096570 [Panicum virgatum]